MGERATTTVFLSLVVAVGLSTAVVGVAGLAIPVSASRSGDEGTRPWDCGSPGAFIAGRSSYRETPLVVTGADAGIGKDTACRAAMASRLGLTTWVLGLGLVATVLLAAVLFTASLWTLRAGQAVVGAVVIAVSALALGRTHPTREVAACDVLAEADLAQVLDTPVQPFAFEPTGGTAGHATGCSYGKAPGVHMTVFSIAPGGRSLVRQQQRALAGRNLVKRDVGGAGYQAFAGSGPRERSESVVVLRGDQYVNVVVYEAPPGTAERLVPLAARALGAW